jgi:hypothetical protein
MRALAAMRETACCQPRMARWAAGLRSASAGQLTQMAVSSAGDGSKKKGRAGRGGPMKGGSGPGLPRATKPRPLESRGYPSANAASSIRSVFPTLLELWIFPRYLPSAKNRCIQWRG